MRILNEMRPPRISMPHPGFMNLLSSIAVLFSGHTLRGRVNGQTAVFSGRQVIACSLALTSHAGKALGEVGRS